MSKELTQKFDEIHHFSDLLWLEGEKKQKENPLVRFLQETVGPPLELEELRTRLAKIRGQMSDIVREQRDERG